MKLKITVSAMLDIDDLEPSWHAKNPAEALQSLNRWLRDGILDPLELVTGTTVTVETALVEEQPV